MVATAPKAKPKGLRPPVFHQSSKADGGSRDLVAGSAELRKYLGRVAAGDREALRAIYRRTSTTLLGLCLRMLRDRSAAEDALQEVYIRVWQRADRFTASEYSPMSWLIAIARNHCIDILRVRKPVFEDIDAVFNLADGMPDPERVLLARDEVERMKLSLRTLEPDKADLIRGAYLDGLSYEQLAQRSGVPLNTVRTWLRRSLAKLRESMEE